MLRYWLAQFLRYLAAELEKPAVTEIKKNPALPRGWRILK